MLRRGPLDVSPPADVDLVCLSHLRWDSVFQRPQHLLSRCARERRVFFVEEPVAGDRDWVAATRTPQGVDVLVPHLAGHHPSDDVRERRLAALLEGAFEERGIRDYILWYYTPMALGFTRHLAPAAVVYDCMDELSAFAGAPTALHERERELFDLADVVFTGGQSLYEAKRDRHPNVHAFPSSVDAAHFAKAREAQPDPLDQSSIPHPRLGFFGVIDERLDRELLAAVAAARPDWHLVLIGPVAKIDPSSLPRAGNIHYLGRKPYELLPSYIAGWDVAIAPFARNEATRYISPTKTPEYLAAGKPVVSTAIRDIVRPYGEKGLARIADTASDFVASVEAALEENPAARVAAVDAFLAGMSWDGTWQRMSRLVQEAVAGRRAQDASERWAG